MNKPRAMSWSRSARSSSRSRTASTTPRSSTARPARARDPAAGQRRAVRPVGVGEEQRVEPPRARAFFQPGRQVRTVRRVQVRRGAATARVPCQARDGLRCARRGAVSARPLPLGDRQPRQAPRQVGGRACRHVLRGPGGDGGARGRPRGPRRRNLAWQLSNARSARSSASRCWPRSQLEPCSAWSGRWRRKASPSTARDVLRRAARSSSSSSRSC